MKFYRDAFLIAVLLIAVFAASQPRFPWSSSPPPTMSVTFASSPGPGFRSHVAVFSNGRIQHVFEDCQAARDFADTLADSDPELRWKIYAAAEELAAYQQSHPSELTTEAAPSAE